MLCWLGCPDQQRLSEPKNGLACNECVEVYEGGRWRIFGWLVYVWVSGLLDGLRRNMGRNKGRHMGLSGRSQETELE